VAASGGGDVPAPIPGAGETPLINEISPRRGPAAGGTPVRISGSGFNGASAVVFGGRAAKVFQVNSDSEILATTPAAPRGDAPVVVSAPGGSSSPSQSFEFVPQPVVEHVEVTSGDQVVVSGSDMDEVLSVAFVQSVLANDDPDAARQSVRTPAASVSAEDGGLRARKPKGPAGPTDVVVTTPGGDSQPYTVVFPVRSSRRWIFWLSLTYLGMLLGGVVAYLQWTGFRDGLPNQLGPVPLAVPWFGALGAVTLSMYGVLWHRVDWDPTYVLWHIVRPVMGVVLGTIAYLLIAGGVVASGGQPSGTANTAPAASPSPSAGTTASAVTSTTEGAGVVATLPSSPALAQSSASTSTTTTTATTKTATVAGGTNPQNPFNNIFYDLVAFLVGFRESTFRELIQRLADLVVGPGSSPGAGRGAGGGGSAGGAPASSNSHT
jgi:hypothetical protein